MKPEDILAIYEASPQSAVKLFNNLMATITGLQETGEATCRACLTG